MSDQYQNICFDDTLSMSSHSNDNYVITNVNEPQQHTESPFASPLENDQAYHLSPYTTPYTPFLPTTTPTATPRISGLPFGSNLSEFPQFQDFGIFGGDDETFVPQPTENLVYEQTGVTSPTSIRPSPLTIITNPPFTPIRNQHSENNHHHNHNSAGSEYLGIYSSPALTTLNTPVTEFIPCTPACNPIASVYNTPLFSVLNTPAIPQTPYFDNTPHWEPSPVFSNVTTPISVRIDNPLPPSVPSNYPGESIDWSIAEDFKPDIELQFAKLDSITYSEDQTSFVVMSNILPDLDSTKCSTEVQSTIDSGSESTISNQVGDNIGLAQANARSTTPRPIRPRPPDDEDSHNQIKRHKSEMGEEDDDDDDNDSTSGEKKQFACPKCDKRFSRKFNMQTHEQTHDTNRVKPFACDHPGCASRFTRKHDLKRHVNGIHKGEKVHLCTACKKPFSRKDAWKRHQSGCSSK